MQLRHYLAIIRRFWPLVALLPLLAGALTLGAALARPTRYTATARLVVTQALPAGADPATLRDQWDGTEFLIDDLPQIVGSERFAQDAGAPPGSLSAETFHRTVTIHAAADTPDQATALAQAAVAALRANGLAYWGRNDATSKPGVNVAVIDEPAAAPDRSLRRIASDALLRAALGLAAGVGLAFLLHYLDTRLRSPGDVEEVLGLPVVGTIPREKL